MPWRLKAQHCRYTFRYTLRTFIYYAVYYYLFSGHVLEISNTAHVVVVAVVGYAV